MYKKMRSALFLLLVAGVGAAAQAATVELNFADGLGNREATNPLIYADNGVEVLVSGSIGTQARNVHINGDTGLGVAGSSEFEEGNRIGRAESLTFSFSQEVAFDQLVAFDEIAVTTPIFFAALVDGELAGVFSLADDTNNFVRVDLSGLGTGSELRLVGLFGSEGWRATGLRVTAVPLPGALMLLGAALVSLAGARRRA